MINRNKTSKENTIKCVFYEFRAAWLANVSKSCINYNYCNNSKNKWFDHEFIFKLSTGRWISLFITSPIKTCRSEMVYWIDLVCLYLIFAHLDPKGTFLFVQTLINQIHLHFFTDDSISEAQAKCKYHLRSAYNYSPNRLVYLRSKMAEPRQNSNRNDFMSVVKYKHSSFTRKKSHSI